jgi:hypothetical protein
MMRKGKEGKERKGTKTRKACYSSSKKDGLELARFFF